MAASQGLDDPWVAHCPRFEMRPLDFSFPTWPVEIRQGPLTPNSVHLEEFSERRLTKYTGQSARKFANGKCGSIAPLRFLNQRTFDQLFMWSESQTFERPLCRFLH